MQWLALAMIVEGVRLLEVGCDSSCKTCAIANDSSACTSCNSGSVFYVNDDYGPCRTDDCATYGGYWYAAKSKCLIGGGCPTGTYLSVKTCNSCPSSCKDCFGGESTQCLSCPSGKTLNLESDVGGSCIDSASCKQTLYSNNLLCATQAANCSVNCSACYSSLATNCRTCNGIGSLLQVENYVNVSDGWGSCSSTVAFDRKYYRFGYNPGNGTQQFKCHWTCQSCVAENDRFSCTSCSSLAYLYIVAYVRNRPVGYCKPACSASTDYKLEIGTRKYCASGTITISHMNRPVSL